MIHAVEHFDGKTILHIEVDIPDDMYICGENLYAIHSIKYDKLPTCFFVFGIVLEDTFLPWESVKTWCELLGLDFVPTIYTGSIVNIPIPSQSNFGPICEGYVARNIEAFQVENFKDNVAKVVRANHVETDERWEDNWEKADFLEDPIDRLVAKRR